MIDFINKVHDQQPGGWIWLHLQWMYFWKARKFKLGKDYHGEKLLRIDAHEQTGWGRILTIQS